MNREEILSMALDAGFMISSQYGQKSHQFMPVSDSSTLEKFTALVAAHEREQCAKCAMWRRARGAKRERSQHEPIHIHPNQPRGSKIHMHIETLSAKLLDAEERLAYLDSEIRKIRGSVKPCGSD